MSAEPSPADSATRSPERIVFFTDAVAAIAMTLLVLPFSELVGEHGSSIDTIVQNQWKIYSFLLSFVVIARLWYAHHRLFEQVRAYSGPLVLVNFCWIFTIAVLPFPTEITGANGTDRFSVLFYVGTILASSACQCALTIIVHRNPVIALNPGGVPQRLLFNSVTNTALLALAFVIGAIWPGLGYYALLLIALPPILARVLHR